MEALFWTGIRECRRAGSRYNMKLYYDVMSTPLWSVIVALISSIEYALLEKLLLKRLIFLEVREIGST